MVVFKASSPRVNFALVGVLSVFVLGCCPQKAGQGEQDTHRAKAAHAVPSAADSGTGILSASPAALPSCQKDNPGLKVTIAWNTGKAGASTVKIFVRDPNGAEKLWTEGGAKGSEITGAWVKPGFVFSAKGGDGNSLGVLTIGSAKCEK